MKVKEMRKVYHSLDFESAKKRIEPNKVAKYQVHLEDFENINDLVRRAVITKTPLKVEHLPELEYDSNDTELDGLKAVFPTNENRTAETAEETTQSNSDAKRSDGEEEEKVVSADPLTLQ